MYLNYVKNLLILVSTVTACVSIFTFSSLFCVSVDIASSAVRICAITVGIKRYKRIIKKRTKSMIKWCC